jgi:hypothetical protein
MEMLGCLRTRWASIGGLALIACVQACGSEAGANETDAGVITAGSSAGGTAGTDVAGQGGTAGTPQPMAAARLAMAPPGRAPRSTPVQASLLSPV